jgi:hypothetical protein
MVFCFEERARDPTGEPPMSDEARSKTKDRGQRRRFGRGSRDAIRGTTASGADYQSENDSRRR